MASLEIRRLGYALGASVTGLNLTRPLDDAVIETLRRAWLQHLVLCFPNQDLSSDQLVRFGNQFGTVDRNGRIGFGADPANPYVAILTNKAIGGQPWDGYKEGQSWHSDKSHTTRPTNATILHCKELPDVGGDTMFTNMYIAYESLSPAMQTLLGGLEGVYDLSLTKGAEKKGAGRQHFKPVAHAIVRTHPETDRKVLYVGPRVREFAGMTQEESRPLLAFLNDHSVRYEFTYRHRWGQGDLVMWDNRCTMHLAVSDYDIYHQPRHMIRCSIQGAPDGYYFGERLSEADVALTNMRSPEVMLNSPG